MELVFLILAILSLGIGLPSFFEWMRGKKYRHYYKVVWKKSSKLRPKEILGEFRPYYEYYYKRIEDDQICEAIENKQNVLIAGAPLSGKTRAAYEALRNLNKPCDILMPESKDIEPDAFRIPKRHMFKRLFSNRLRIVFLDDLHNLVDQKHFDHLIREVLKLQVPVIATCRSGVEQSKVVDKCSSKGIEVEMVFGDSVVEFEKVSEDVAKKVAKKVEKSWDEVDFDGNIGSVLFPLKAMKERYTDCTDFEKTMLCAMSTLYHFGVFYGEQVFPIEWIKRLTKEEELEGKEYEWNEWLEGLEKKEFIVIEKDEVRSEEVYLEKIVSPLYEETDIGFYKRLIELFEDVPDALVVLGNKAYEVGEDRLDIAQFIQVAIEAYQGALGHWTKEEHPLGFAYANNVLGVSFCQLAEIEEKKQNCKNATDAYRRALEIYTFDRLPEDYAITQNNLGNIYVRLAEVVDKAENCKLAIAAHQEALKVYVDDRFPMEYAMTQNNLGVAYFTLAEVVGKAENCKLAILAFMETLKLLTCDRYPADYAMTKNNLGNAYQRLADVERTAENCRLAVGEYQEALKVYTIDRFPMDYAKTKNNLGAAYQMLAEVDGKMENCKAAVELYEEALKVLTFDRFPIQYAGTKINQGIAYRKLAEEEEKGENCKRAINAYMEALKVYTEDELPLDFHRTVNNLRFAVDFCKDVLPEEMRKMLDEE